MSKAGEINYQNVCHQYQATGVYDDWPGIDFQQIVGQIDLLQNKQNRSGAVVMQSSSHGQNVLTSQKEGSGGLTVGPSQFKSGDDFEIRADNNRSAWLGPPVWKTHISIDLASDPVRLTQTGLKVDHKSVRQVPSKEPVPTEPSLGRNPKIAKPETSEGRRPTEISTPDLSTELQSRQNQDELIRKLLSSLQPIGPIADPGGYPVQDLSVKYRHPSHASLTAGFQDTGNGTGALLAIPPMTHPDAAYPGPITPKTNEQLIQIQANPDFCTSDLALASAPGGKFDPGSRLFMPEELKPQPIIRKRSKLYVEDGSKTEDYWTKRVTNNIAARKSREARRIKENQIALRAAYLEHENCNLRCQVQSLADLNEMLKKNVEKLKGNIKAIQQHQ